MSDFLSPIFQWIHTHPELAGLATFVISAAESIAIIGTIVPGTVMMTAIGALAGAGVMPLWSTIVWAILGAVVGDGISYWIGHYFKDRIHFIWPFRVYPNLLASGERFFHKHGGKSVFIGRFVGPVRALVPLVAGMLGMKPWRFTIANVTSAIGWAPAYMLPGIALGAASLELPPDIAVHAILMLVLVGLFIILCLWIIQKLFLLIGGRINQSLTRIWQRLQASQYFFPITTLLKHYNPKKTYGQLTLAFYFIVTIALFIYLASYISLHGAQHILINNSTYYLFRSLRTPNGDTIMLYTTLLGDSKVLFPLVITLFAWLGWKKNWRTAWHVLALGILSYVGIESIKHFVNSPRPWGIVQPPKGMSFPSGHTTLAVTFFLGMAFLFITACRQKFRRIFYVVATIIIASIAISRIYLGAHWLTDVLGGLLLGSAILMLIILSYNRQPEKPIQPLGIIAVAFVTLFVSYSAIFLYSYQSLKRNYAQLDWPTYTITLDAWWHHQGEHVPLYRLNRFGFSTQILNLQWVGDLSKIRDLLLQNDWQEPSEADWITVLHRVSDVQSAEHLPLVSPLYLDKKPVLVLTKPATNNKKLIVLRLWNPNIIINNVKQPLWVGTVEVVPRTYSWLFKPRRSNEIRLTAKRLFSTMPQGYTIKEIKVINMHRQAAEQKQTMVLIRPSTLNSAAKT